MGVELWNSVGRRQYRTAATSESATPIKIATPLQISVSVLECYQVFRILEHRQMPKPKGGLDMAAELKKGIQLIENDLEDKGRVLVRYSGTEMLCRIMIECEKQKEAFQYANRLADVVRTEIGVA